ncbi:copper amine oxidase N-terminal domain-containing protein [Ammonifex degensii]|uniref:copper amine oxidase N-terminal domain-containing protein n=1 Tax=Ammonifex degensii TaxID=42838 RepID=UPI001FE0B2C5|nr:copper amine oxidase N-terminal domain-containing protein [Ammonifex degensii]
MLRNFRKVTVAVLVVALLILTAAWAAVAVQAPRVVVDGRLISCDPPPFISAGRVFVPVRILAQAMGYKVEWDADNRVVVLERNVDGVDLTSGLPPMEGLEDALGVDKPASVGGQQYVRGFLINRSVSWVLDGKFKELRFFYGAVDTASTPFEQPGKGVSYALVVADGKVVAELSAEKGQSPQEIRISVAGVKRLSIERAWRHYHGGVVINPVAISN